MPSVMERSGAGVLSRSRAKTVTNGNSQPHSEEDSSDEEHAHGTAAVPLSRPLLHLLCSLAVLCPHTADPPADGRSSLISQFITSSYPV
ncbi:unnamed protein product [Tetraodon nigroviridis]|uniref:Chromosome undetermined SCAF14779, whole genome shotgun sequence n=1 Tax=Tetraodon nigroviridis TaxID=99883 RepID=Q4S0V1_TETNG|nr:unnamed protein product [Tetraodon nigroviridis]